MNAEPCLEHRYNMESRACGLLIHGPAVIARKACADALRAWRTAGSWGVARPDRARWFRFHISRTGYPVKS